MSHPAETKVQEQDKWKTIKWNGWGTPGKYLDFDKNGDALFTHNHHVLPGLRPFIKEKLSLPSAPMNFVRTPSVNLKDVILPAPKIHAEFMAEITKSFSASQVSHEHDQRVCHMYGKSLRDLHRLRKGVVHTPPDVILYPQCHDDVEKIVKAAHKHNVTIIAFGGGSNIVGAVEATPVEEDKNERRMIASIDMRRMTRLLWVSKRSHSVNVEVGIMGPDLEKALGQHGLSMGHDPDSFEFSCLGGWMATCSSGHFSDKYGDIEDMVVSLKVVTPTGTLVVKNAPRGGAGPQLKHLILGSEGTLGIITEAVIKVHSIPDTKDFQGYFFPSFETAVHALEEMHQTSTFPTMMRIYDPSELQLSLSMRPKKGVAEEVLSFVVKQYLQYIKRYDMTKVCMAIVGHEGTKAEVDFAMSITTPILKKHYAFGLGKSAGDSWQEKRYDLPYIRDFILDYDMWCDVAETSVLWPSLIPLWTKAKQQFLDDMHAKGIPAWICAHVSHTYSNGACLYFIFAAKFQTKKDMETYTIAKRLMTNAILSAGGTLSHHHAVGYEHKPFMARYAEGWLPVLRAIKSQIDPKNICNPGKLLPSPEEEAGKQKYLFDTLMVQNTPSKL